MTDPNRTLAVGSEIRVYTVATEVRVSVPSVEDRIYEVGHEARTSFIKAAPNVVVVPAGP